MPQATALEDLNIGEISGVDHPAHLEEGWMVLKAAGAAPDAMAKVEIVEALVDAVEKAAAIDSDLLAQVGAEVLDDSARNTLSHLLTKATKEATVMPEFDKATLDPDALSYVESLEAQIAAATVEASPPSEEAMLTKALEGLPEPVRKHLADQAEALAKATATAETERNKRLDAEYMEKARGFRNLTVSTEDLAAMLRKVADLDADLFIEVDRILKAADAQVNEATLFSSIGAPAPIESGSAHQSLDSIAKAAVAAGEAVDYPTALAKAAEDHPHLYAQHRAEASSSKEG